FVYNKMGKKRRNDESAESDTPRKKETIPEFNGTVFKAMLKDPTIAMKGLEKFISTAKKLPRSDLYDVVEGYIKISMECAEIFKLLEGEKHVESEMMLIFGSLEAILLRTASDLSHFNMVGNAIVKKTVFSYMKLLQGSFRSANHRFIRQCLGLLCALVTQGPEAAREVLSHLHINKFLSGLAKMKDKQVPDVRQAFIQFVLSFVVSGDNTTVGQILEIKELLPVILNTGLKEDRMSTVNLILSTLKTKVVLNKAISKTQKVRFFTPAVLASIASLYKWNGIADFTLTFIRELAHSFLLDLCCSRKHGISFHDVSFGTAGRPGNIVLLQFLVGLKQATEDELVADLVVNVLKATPDILSRYFKETQYAYAPRLKTTWQDNVKLLKKIYEAQPEISTVFQTQEVIPLPRLLSMVMVISLPPVCNKSFFTQGLIVTHLTTLSVVNFILKRASKNIEYLLDKSVWCSSDLYTAEMMEDLVQQYREMLGKILPDMTSIIEKWQSLSKKEKAGSEEKKDKSEGDAKLTKSEDTAEVILLKALILQLICLYQKVVPHLVSQCKFDFSKLLKGIVSEKGIKEEIPPVLQHHVLQLALDLPASKFSWFRMQGAADKDSSSGEKSVFYLLLKMFVSSSSSHLKASTQMLVLKVLKDTGVFEHTWTELELWLEQLARLEPNQQETVIQFLERVLVKLVCSSYEYTDKVASLVQEAGYLQANLSSQEGDTASVPVSHIDDVIDMLDVIMEASDGELEEFGPAVSEDLIMQTFPFSALVPATLEARNKLPADRMVYEYLAAVLSDVLHCQREPLPLCLALLQYDKEFVSSECCTSPHSAIVCFHQYYSKWLPQQCREELVGLSDQTSYTALMKAAYIQGPDTLLKDTFRKSAEEALASFSLGEFPVAIKQILLYIRSTVENFGTVGAQNKLRPPHIVEYANSEAKNSEPAVVKSQEGSDLFLELNQSSTILLSALGSIFKHPYLEQWFLALELSAMPPHSLNPVRLKQLCSLMTDNILVLLKLCAPVLQELNHLELLRSYMGALERAALQELVEKGSKPAKKHSRTFQSLLSLHNYMDSSNLREVVSKLLLLPHNSLISPSSSKGANFELSIYGQAALQILTECKYTASQDHGTFLTQAHLFGLGTLLLSCSKPALEAFLLQFLSSEPSSAKLLHTDVLLHCLQRPLSDSLAISSLLLQNCSTHRLRFEMWCLEPENMEKLSDQSEAFLPLINMYLHMLGCCCFIVQKDILKALKQVLLAKFSQCVLGNLTEESGAQLTETLGSLIKLSANSKDIRDLINSLPSALQNVDNVISDKLADCPEEQEKWRKSVATAAIKCLIASYSHSKDQATSPLEQEHSILKRLQRVLVGLLHISKEDITASEWNNFVKNGLKYLHICYICLFLIGRNLDWQLLCAIIDLFHVLWFTALGQKEKQVDEAKTSLSAEEKPQSFVKCLPPPLISEFLCVASTITRHLGLGLKAAQLSLFLQTICSVLKHRATALHVSKQADRLTLHPQPLSCTEALALLHCWASSSHNTELLTQIQALSEKHKVKEVMGMRKDKARVKSSLSHVYMRKEKLAEDTETENEDKSLLTECKLYLTNIFVHWEPAFQLSEPQPALPTDKLDPSWLTRITAHLVTKWSLRCLVEDSYDENRAKEFLLWLEKAVIKHTKIADVVLLDLGLKADLLRLYHQAFEAQCHSSISARAGTLQLFTKIMISLLEIQGNLPELHQAVVSACIPEATLDQTRLGKKAGLSLLSLYIHEVWSGATSADLFLSHVSLVTGAKCKKVKSSQKKADIRDICNDIITMKS
uniref:URB1 ribosome biogenesis homolog n=1 Tax=Neolamprologus brichardi TaxID=32507 RepID=A0A3Q4G050_NEOBR